MTSDENNAQTTQNNASTTVEQQQPEAAVDDVSRSVSVPLSQRNDFLSEHPETNLELLD